MALEQLETRRCLTKKENGNLDGAPLSLARPVTFRRMWPRGDTVIALRDATEAAASSPTCSRHTVPFCCPGEGTGGEAETPEEEDSISQMVHSTQMDMAVLTRGLRSCQWLSSPYLKNKMGDKLPCLEWRVCISVTKLRQDYT